MVAERSVRSTAEPDPDPAVDPPPRGARIIPCPRPGRGDTRPWRELVDGTRLPLVETQALLANRWLRIIRKLERIRRQQILFHNLGESLKQVSAGARATCSRVYKEK